jgi:hypothetical protein
MSDPAEHHLLMMGLPEAGKTSFLGALWYMVDQNHLDCELVLEKLEGERKYLNEIRAAWLKCRPVPRNLFDVQEMVSMLLRDRRTGASTVLNIPDLSGEAFKRQWTKRELTVAYDNVMRDARGGMLFIRADGVDKPRTIFELNENLRSIGLGAISRVRRSFQPAAPQWDSEKTPTQVKLVELLQVLSNRDYFQPRFRVAVIISAFDLLLKTEITPQSFFERELPLLKQFLDGNQHLFEAALFGISAQGGRYASPIIQASMLKDVMGLAKRLVAATDPLSRWIWEKLDSSGQTGLKAGHDEGSINTILVQHFNSLLGASDFFDPDRFSSVTLDRKTEALLDEVLSRHLEKGVEGLILNRRLLDDAFPNELAREWLYAQEHAGLEKLLPAERITVVGADVQNSHDLTQPIRWLMR